MKKLIKVSILLAVFILAVIFFINNNENNLYTSTKVLTESMEHNLPTVRLKSDTVVCNRMNVHTSKPDINERYDNIVPVGKNKELVLLIDENGKNIKKVTYTLFNEKSDKQVERGEVNAFGTENGEKSVSLKFESELKENEAYKVNALLIDEKGEYYYLAFRVKYLENSYFAQKAEFVKYISENARTKSQNNVIPYLESTYRGMGQTYSYVNIYDSFFMMDWGNLYTEMIYADGGNIKKFVNTVTEPELYVYEIYKSVMVAELRYVVKLHTETGDGDELFKVSERFRVSVDQSSKHLNDYERRLDAFFEPDNASLTQNQLKIGLSSEDYLKYIVSEEGHIVAFVRNNELWCYDLTENKITKVFAFFEDTTSQMNVYNRYGIKLVNINGNGDINFVVYGHMCAGNHEGEDGISIYRYFRKERRIEEIAFLKISRSFEMIKDEVEASVCVDKTDELFFSCGNCLYRYSIADGTLNVLTDNIRCGAVFYDKDENFITWQEEGKDSEIQVIKIDDVGSLTIRAGIGQFIRLFGTSNGNIIYGLGNRSDMLSDMAGNRIFACEKVYIADKEGKIKKEYLENGYYTEKVAVGEDKITLYRLKKTGDERSYEVASEDNILILADDVHKNTLLKQRVTDLMGVEYYLSLPGNYKMKEKPKLEKTQVTSGNRNNTIEVNTERTGKNAYYVYSLGYVKAVTDDLSEAINIATVSAGTVTDSNGKVLWERGIKSNRTILDISDEALAVYATDDLYKTFEKEAENGYTIKLRGITLDDVLYYVYRGAKIMSLRDEKMPVLIIGYDISPVDNEKKKVIIFNSATKAKEELKLKDAKKIFEETGNIYLTYMGDIKE